MVAVDGMEWTLHKLGYLYDSQAEKMYQWTLQGYEKARDPDHISSLDTVNNLGLDQGRLDEAEKMYQRALQGAWGPDHMSTLDKLKLQNANHASKGISPAELAKLRWDIRPRDDTAIEKRKEYPQGNSSEAQHRAVRDLSKTEASS